MPRNSQDILSFQLVYTDSSIEVFLDESLLPATDFSHLECSFSLYPTDPYVKASDFHFNPYEDYVADLSAQRRSTYGTIISTTSQLFGMSLGLLIFFFFLVFFPQQLISVESVVSIFAAYTVGKEIWADIDAYLQEKLKGHRVRWSDQEFFYKRNEFGTLQRFWQKARLQRYNYQVTLPTKLDFISHSNSKTIEMFFEQRDLVASKERVTRILSISFSKSASRALAEKKYLLVLRFASVKKWFILQKVEEYYQAINNGENGTLDLENIWHKNSSLRKDVIKIGKFQWLKERGKTVSKP